MGSEIDAEKTFNSLYTATAIVATGPLGLESAGGWGVGPASVYQFRSGHAAAATTSRALVMLEPGRSGCTRLLAPCPPPSRNQTSQLRLVTVAQPRPRPLTAQPCAEAACAALQSWRYIRGYGHPIQTWVTVDFLPILLGNLCGKGCKVEGH